LEVMRKEFRNKKDLLKLILKTNRMI
jgi:hypothetical protein